MRPIPEIARRIARPDADGPPTAGSCRVRDRASAGPGGARIAAASTARRIPRACERASLAALGFAR